MTINKKIGLSTIVFIVYCLYYISGYTGSAHNYFIVALFLCWNLIAFLEDKKAYEYAIGNKSFGYLLLFILYYFFTSFIIADFLYTIEYVVIFLCLYGTMIQYRYYSFRNKIYEIKLIVYSLMAGFVFFSISAILFYTINPSAARILAADFYAFDNIAIGGGYAIAFGSSILSVYLVETIIRKKITRGKRFLFVFLIILFEILIIKTESTTTLIANVFGIIWGVVNKKLMSKSKIRGSKILIYFFLVILFFLIILNINNIGKFIVSVTSSGTENVLIRRFNRIGLKMKYHGIQTGYKNYVDERFGTIATSWNTFLKYPLFGIGYKCGNIFSLLEMNGVGTHSELFDVLAQYGIIGFLFWISFIYNSLKCQSDYYKCKGWKITFLIMLIFNPFRSFHGYIVVFFIIPMIEYLIKNRFIKKGVNYE